MVTLEHINRKFLRLITFFAEKSAERKGSQMLADCFSEDTIIFLDPKDRDEALFLLAEKIAQGSLHLSTKKIHDAVIDREKIVSTGIGGGVALPHAKLEGIEEFALGLAICQSEGVEWNALDGQLVKFIFMIVGPSNQPKAYLKMLSSLTSLLKQQRFLDQLFLLRDSSKILHLISQFESLST